MLESCLKLSQKMIDVKIKQYQEENGQNNQSLEEEFARLLNENEELKKKLG